MEGLINNIPVIFPDLFPENYVNNVLGWGIPEDELHSKLPDGTYKFLSMDIDFGLKCSLHCPHCFQNNQNSYNFKKKLSWDETLVIVDKAKVLGLKYVKILGAGEPFENREFLNFLIELDKRDIHTAIFTKGHVLGSDELVNKFFGKQGIKTSEELVRILYKLKTSILLGFNSFNREMQNSFIGMEANSNYPDLRNRALTLLANTGFNKFIPNSPTRLAIVPAPIKPENISEIFDIYKWGLIRNIYVSACPTTSSGNGNIELERETSLDFAFYIDEVKKLYIKIYEWAIQKRIVKSVDFFAHGVSLYPGAHPCNQVACGLYVRLDGSVYLCPGNDSPDFLVKSDVRDSSLRDIWINSKNYRLARQHTFNFQCIARRNTFFKGFPNFYTDVYNAVIKTISE